MRSLLERILLCHQSSIPSSQRLVIVPLQIVSPVCWIVSRRYQLEPLRLIPYQKNIYPWQGTSMRLGILSLLISSFAQLLADYPMVMAESPHIFAFKAVISTMLHFRVWFGLITKSHLEVTILWLASHGLKNSFGNKLQRKSPITMTTMACLQWMNTSRILMPKGRLRVFRILWPAS